MKQHRPNIEYTVISTKQQKRNSNLKVNRKLVHAGFEEIKSFNFYHLVSEKQKPRLDWV